MYKKNLIKVTIIVDISIIGFNAHCMRPARSYALCVGNMPCIRYQLATFFTIRTQIVFFIFYGWTVRRLCVTGASLGQRKHNEFRECVLYLCLTLDWRWSVGLLTSTFTRGKNAHIFEHAENVRRV